MGGVIAIDSQPGLGSRFHFELALHRQPGAQPAPAPLPPAGRQAHPGGQQQRHAARHAGTPAAA
jgi:hypothetical protein